MTGDLWKVEVLPNGQTPTVQVEASDQEKIHIQQMEVVRLLRILRSADKSGGWEDLQGVL